MVTRLARQKPKDKVFRVSPQERHRQQQVLNDRIREYVTSSVRLIIQSALEQQIEELVGRGRYQHANPHDQSKVWLHCNRCRTTRRRHFRRAGHYQRSLLSEFWSVQLDVPRLRCRCGGTVRLEFTILTPYNRLWPNLEERIRQLAGLCLSLRDSCELLAATNGTPLSPTTLDKRINEIEVLAEAMREGELREVPAVVMLDGLWVKALEPTEKWKTDKGGRRRRVKRRERFPLLVAYGVDPQTGDKRVLDWEKGREEDVQSWGRLLERLWRRGVSYRRGLRLFIHDGSKGLEKALEGLELDFGVEVKRQRDIFHKLMNVGEVVEGEEGMGRKEKWERRQEVIKEAAQVYRGEDREEIYGRLERFKERWKGQEPKAVETLERDFEATVRYLEVLEQARREGKEWEVRYLRGTGALERGMRAFRQKVRQVVIFHSERGLKAAIYLVIAHRWPGSTTSWYKVVEETLLAA